MAYSFDSPRGFELQGNPDDFFTIDVKVNSGDTIYIGDAVMEDTVTSGEGMRAAAASLLRGVSIEYGVGANSDYVKVIADPRATFVVQFEDNSNAIAQTDVFSGFDLHAGSAPSG